MTPRIRQRLAVVGWGAAALSGCTGSTLRPDPHYVLGSPYRAASAIWFYPKEAFELNETGIAAVTTGDTACLTSDGEVFDQTALAGSHPTVQLPAIARVTNLENGRQVTIRLNDRGAGDPHRLVEVTQRTAELLGMSVNGLARVRLVLLPSESRAAAEGLPGAPALAIAAAPRNRVEVAELAPFPGVHQAGGVTPLTAVVMAAVPTLPAAPPPLRLQEAVAQTAPNPGRLMVQLDTFDNERYAAMQRARMAHAGAHVVSLTDGHTRRYRVQIGPLPDIPSADSVLDQALAVGIPDARIVVD